MNIPDDWLPTSENLNSLPAPVRTYIHELESLCDPAGIVAGITLQQDLCRQLTARYKFMTEERAALLTRKIKPSATEQMLKDEIVDLSNTLRVLNKRKDSLYDSIKHGDDKHKQWLKEAIDCHFNGLNVPKPR